MSLLGPAPGQLCGPAVGMTDKGLAGVAARLASGTTVPTGDMIQQLSGYG